MGSQSPRTERARVLVVDDDQVFCAILEDWLGTVYDVLVTDNAEDGLRLAGRSRPVAILLDARLPDMGGISLGWILRHDARFRRIPVLFLGAEGRPLVDAPAGGADEIKELSLDYLSAFLHEHIVEAFQDLGLEVPHPHSAARTAPPRAAVNLPAVLTSPAGIAEGAVLALSGVGAFVACEDEIPTDTGALLSFEYGAHRFTQEAHVMYTALREGQRGVGLRFAHLTKGSEDVLLQILMDHAHAS